MLAVGGISFLTPLDSLFMLAAAAPIAALALTERRAEQVRRVFGVRGPGRRGLVAPVAALALLPVLVGVAAAQPVVVRSHSVAQRADAQAFFVFDTSLSMEAAARAGAPIRLTRAKELALRLERALPEVPIGIAGMTDRVLPYAMPTTDPALFRHTLDQSVGIDEPPPSQVHRGRASTFAALVPVVESHFFSSAAKRRLLVVFTDGEAEPLPPYFGYTLHVPMAMLFVHVWAPGERIYHRGRADPKYVSDPAGLGELDRLARIVSGQVFAEGQAGALERAARDAVGRGGAHTSIQAYARVALAPWFLLGGILPLGFLLYRRNF